MLSSFFGRDSPVRPSVDMLLRVYVLLGRIIGLSSNLHLTPDSEEHKAELGALENATQFFSLAAYQDEQRRTITTPFEVTMALWFNVQLCILNILLHHPNPLGFENCMEAVRHTIACLRRASEMHPRALQNPMLAQVIFLCCRFLVIDHASNSRHGSRYVCRISSSYFLPV